MVKIPGLGFMEPVRVCDACFEALRNPPFSPEVIAADREFVCKKFGLSDEEMEAILNAPPRSHRDFANDERWETLYDRFSSGWLQLRERLRRLVVPGKA
jgi:hypothetical protein